MSSVELVICATCWSFIFHCLGFAFLLVCPVKDNHTANNAVSTGHTDEGRFCVLKEGWDWLRAGWNSDSGRLWVITYHLMTSLLLAILGYGFSLPNNPDDTITLQIDGAANPQKWVIGRHARNVEGLWSDIRHMIAKGESEYEFEDDLETAAVLSDMVQAKLDGIKTVAEVQQSDGIRPMVRIMLEPYFAGRHLDLFVGRTCYNRVQDNGTS